MVKQKRACMSNGSVTTVYSGRNNAQSIFLFRRALEKKYKITFFRSESDEKLDDPEKFINEFLMGTGILKMFFKLLAFN